MTKQLPKILLTNNTTGPGSFIWTPDNPALTTLIWRVSISPNVVAPLDTYYFDLFAIATNGKTLRPLDTVPIPKTAGMGAICPYRPLLVLPGEQLTGLYTGTVPLPINAFIAIEYDQQ